MQDLEEKFKAEIIKALTRACHRARVCKRSDLEHVVLLGNKRISLNGKSVWTSKKFAEQAIIRYISGGSLWYLKPGHIWGMMTGDFSHPPPPSATSFTREVRTEWANKNLRTIPLRDYMVFEHNRAKHGKK